MGRDSPSIAVAGCDHTNALTHSYSSRARTLIFGLRINSYELGRQPPLELMHKQLYCRPQ
jgi:hypothetical protein